MGAARLRGSREDRVRQAVHRAGVRPTWLFPVDWRAAEASERTGIDSRALDLLHAVDAWPDVDRRSIRFAGSRAAFRVVLRVPDPVDCAPSEYGRALLDTIARLREWGTDEQAMRLAVAVVRAVQDEARDATIAAVAER